MVEMGSHRFVNGYTDGEDCGDQDATEGGPGGRAGVGGVGDGLAPRMAFGQDCGDHSVAGYGDRGARV